MPATLNHTEARAFINQLWDDSVIPTLEAYIRIPCKSPAFDPQWEANGHLRQAAEMLSTWCDTLDIAGMRKQIMQLPGRTPLLFAEIDATGGYGSALLYGHYDKQPEFSGWLPGLSPWEPVLRDGKLYGRGGADDGYALFGMLSAVAALQKQQVPHGRLLLIIEGCEESGSYDLPHYVEALKEAIGTPDLVVCLDAECGNYDQLWTTTSLRGLLLGTLTVEVLTEGQHSGAAGGIVPSSFRILRNLIERVEDSTTGELHACLQQDVPPQAVTQLNAVAQTLGAKVVDRFPWAGTTCAEVDDTGELLIRNAWKPSLATVGISGAPAIEDAGNTLRPLTQAKLAFRLPPTLDAEVAANAVKTLFETDPPHGASVRFEQITPQSGWAARPFASWLESALQAASQAAFKRPAMHMGMGGTIPFMKMLGDAYPDVQFMVTGVLGPASNAHGPNEFLHIETGKRLSLCVTHVIAALSEYKRPG